MNAPALQFRLETEFAESREVALDADGFPLLEVRFAYNDRYAAETSGVASSEFCLNLGLLATSLGTVVAAGDGCGSAITSTGAPSKSINCEPNAVRQRGQVIRAGFALRSAII